MHNPAISTPTCLAAKELNRKFIGIEKDEEYFKIALNRFNKKDNQQELF